MSKVVFIVNEHAGNGRGKKIWMKWKEAITFPYMYFRTERNGHATEIARNCASLSEEDLLIVAVGGDGTIHEVIVGITGYTHVRVGVISAGSGNDFGRAFSVFQTIEQLDQYVQDTYRFDTIDIGLLTTEETVYPIVNNAGFGFDAKVAYSVNRSKWKKRLNTFGLGKLTYLLFVIKELFTFSRFSFSLHSAEKKVMYKDVWFLVVCNQPYFGGGMKISPDSNPKDNLIELTIVYKLPRWKLLFIFGTVFFGKHTKYKEVIQFQANDYTLTMHDEVFGHVDGEFSCITEKNQLYTFTVQSNAWNLAEQTGKRRQSNEVKT
ncbi:diacylglycerol kinase family protein [Bacillus sp. FJAT-22090]|uniref:diacylglycerol/lipid kinase family protein n=1 Tax=Bacillus sp. FJAT-22090 TaxID=1581038 RepID=UPI00119DDE76|nr:diacylglycerol kinase family protein [Bacillus sp. FJAT-22090]